MDSCMRMKTIPGLPEDLGVDCLVKVPYKSHNLLRAVSKSWNALLSTPNFYKERQHHNECEEGVASLYPSRGNLEVIIYYPHGNWWEKLPPIPEEFKLELQYHYDCVCVYVRSKQRLVILGLLKRHEFRANVLMFDFLSRTWLLGLEMPFRGCDYACRASSSPKGLVYIAGGLQGISPPQIDPHLLEAYVFNVEENKWDFLPSMNPDRPQRYCTGDFVDDKFYVFPSHGHSVHVYHPHTRLWETFNTRNNSEHVVNCISAFGKLYRLGRRAEFVIVEEFNFASNSFTTIEEYPAHISAIYCAVLCRDCIFVSAEDSTNKHNVYYLFNLLETEEGKRWTRIEMPEGFPAFRFISERTAAVQI